MFCSHCGNQCKDGAKFCAKCGAPLFSVGGASDAGKRESAYGGGSGNFAVKPVVGANADDIVSETKAGAGEGSGNGKRRKGIRAAIIIVILAAAAAFAAYFFLLGGGDERRFEKHMEAGRIYLEEEAYEEAVDEFEAAIDIRDNVVEPYQMMAQAYIGLEDDENVDETYDTVRHLVVTTYEDSDGQELLDDAKEVYLEAVDYYDSMENTEKADEVINEIAEMLPDDADIQKALSERSAQNTGVQEETEAAGESAEKPDEGSILALLEPFKRVAMDIISDDTDDSVSKYEEISEDEALELAARAIGETELYDRGSDSYYPYVDGHIWESSSNLTNEQLMSCALYFSLPDGVYEEYLTNMFGLTLDLSEVFTVSSSSYFSPIAVQEDGHFYFLAGEYGDGSVDVYIKNMSETPDSDGAYDVTVQYYFSIYGNGTELNTYSYYMRYRIAKSDKSEYGCVILGMIPAGVGALEE